MYEHYRAGRFGNTLRTWPDYFSMADSGIPARIGLRYSGPVGGGYTAYDMTEEQALRTFFEFQAQGADPEKIVWCEAAPDQQLIFQGEICQDASTGYALHWSPFKAQMKIALAKDPRNHNGTGSPASLQVSDGRGELRVPAEFARRLPGPCRRVLGL
jgi:hypothetical protein